AENPPVLEREPEVAQTPEPEVIPEPLEIPAEEESKQRFSFSLDDEPTEMIFDFEKKIAVEEVFDRPLNDDERRLLEEKSNAPKAQSEEFIILDDKAQKSDNLTNEEEDIEPFVKAKDEMPKN